MATGVRTGFIAVRGTVCVGRWGLAGGMLLCADGGVGPGWPGRVGLGAGCVCAACVVVLVRVPGGVAGCDGVFLSVGGRRAVGVAGCVMLGVGGRGPLFRACLLVWAGRGGVNRVCCSWWLDCLGALLAVAGPVKIVPALGARRQWWRGACVSGCALGQSAAVWVSSCVVAAMWVGALGAWVVGCGCSCWCAPGSGPLRGSGLAVVVHGTVCVGWWGVAVGVVLCAEYGVGPSSRGWLWVGTG